MSVPPTTKHHPWLELQLTASLTESVSPSRLALLIHLSCSPFVSSGTLTAVRRPREEAPLEAIERALAPADIDQISALLRSLRLPGRQLALTCGVMLDAEWSANTIICIQDASTGRSTMIRLVGAGFDGDDADGVRQLLRLLLQSARLAASDYWWMLGVPRGEG